jgi:hypothetical protein
MVLQKLGEKDMAELIPAVQVFLFSRSELCSLNINQLLLKWDNFVCVPTPI